MENILHFLVRDDLGYPYFVPSGLFEVGVWEIPSHWRFGLCSGIRASGKRLWVDPCAAVWGYDELVRDPTHAAALGELEPVALEVFYKHLQAETATGSQNDDLA